MCVLTRARTWYTAKALPEDPYTQTREALLDGKKPLVYTHCRISITAGPDTGKVVETERELIRVGTGDENELELSDPAVSRVHMELRKSGGEYNLVDVGSTNGTFVGVLQIKEATLRTKSEILIGDSTLLFEPKSTEVPFEAAGTNRCGEMVGDSVSMRETFNVLERVAPTELAILVTGETGTGKELAARAAHEKSKRKGGPFVTLALGALPPKLIESALFGHEKGALPGAESTYAGAFERASGGTLFLDELSELPLELQPRLLRAIERGEIERLGGHDPVRVDARLVAATGFEIKDRVESGQFRSDLYYRLAVIHLDLPPLRDRVDDIPILVQDFFERHSQELQALGAKARRLSQGGLGQLQKYTFPGNVRELINILRRASATASTEEILVTDLPSELTEGGSSLRAANAPNAVVLPDASMRFKDAKAQVLDAFERQYLQDLLKRHEQNISKAAREAGIDRRHLYRLLDKYEIETKDRGD